MKRWWVYQRERFPVFAHGPLIVAFSLCAVCFSSLLRGEARWPAGPVWLVALGTSFISFLHLRLADEFKDFEEDSRFRPYRPVPRGLVQLRELAWLWAGSALLQLGLALWLEIRLVPYLALTWAYLTLMSREFFVRAWIKARPFTYMWTHMLIMPLIDFYATACDWLPAQGRAPAGLGWFVAASFFNGFNLEIGRKIRAPADEEAGVETYSRQWGRGRAVGAWWLTLLASGGSAGLAARAIGFAEPLLIGLGVLWMMAVAAGAAFLRAPQPGAGRRLEAFSGVWTLFLYSLLGVGPMLWRLWP